MYVIGNVTDVTDVYHVPRGLRENVRSSMIIWVGDKVLDQVKYASWACTNVEYTQIYLYGYFHRFWCENVFTAHLWVKPCDFCPLNRSFIHISDLPIPQALVECSR